MKYLIDTHIFLWAVTMPEKNTLKVRKILDDFDNFLFISIVSLWEIAIKHSIGKLELSVSFDDLQMAIVDNKITVLDISYQAVKYVDILPLYHRDPFDRMLVAQSMADDLTILSKDIIFDEYKIKRIW